MKEIVQLVGPVSRVEHGNMREFTKAQKHYEGKGFKVINPHDIATSLRFHHEVNGMPEPGEKEILAYCMQSLLNGLVKKVFVLEGFTNSTGAPCEMLVCQQYNIPMYEAYTDRPLQVGAILSVSFQGENKIIDAETHTWEITINDYR